MTAYRFCRTDDMGLLVAAYERCRGPEDAGVPALDLHGFKRLVRGLDLWCSSCMVALEGREPVGVLLGAKRPAATLIYGLRVHPEHRRRGHGRHLLTSLGQKLAILGPPKLLAEVPAERAAACAVFSACGWAVEARLVDWRRESLQPAADEAAAGEAVAPISLRDLIDGGQLDSMQEGSRCWQRDLPALSRLEDQLLGLGFHSSERLEAWVLYRQDAAGHEILAVGFVSWDLGRLGLRVLLEDLAREARGAPLVFSRVAPAEIEPSFLAELGFEPGPEHVLFSTRAQAA